MSEQYIPQLENINATRKDSEKPKKNERVGTGDGPRESQMEVLEKLSEQWAKATSEYATLAEQYLSQVSPQEKAKKMGNIQKVITSYNVEFLAIKSRIDGFRRFDKGDFSTITKFMRTLQAKLHASFVHEVEKHAESISPRKKEVGVKEEGLVAKKDQGNTIPKGKENITMPALVMKPEDFLHEEQIVRVLSSVLPPNFATLKEITKSKGLKMDEYIPTIIKNGAKDIAKMLQTLLQRSPSLLTHEVAAAFYHTVFLQRPFSDLSKKIRDIAKNITKKSDIFADDSNIRAIEKCIADTVYEALLKCQGEKGIIAVAVEHKRKELSNDFLLQCTGGQTAEYYRIVHLGQFMNERDALEREQTTMKRLDKNKYNTSPKSIEEISQKLENINRIISLIKEKLKIVDKKWFDAMKKQPGQLEVFRRAKNDPIVFSPFLLEKLDVSNMSTTSYEDAKVGYKLWKDEKEFWNYVSSALISIAGMYLGGSVMNSAKIVSYIVNAAAATLVTLPVKEILEASSAHVEYLPKKQQSLTQEIAREFLLNLLGLSLQGIGRSVISKYNLLTMSTEQCRQIATGIKGAYSKVPSLAEKAESLIDKASNLSMNSNTQGLIELRKEISSLVSLANKEVSITNLINSNKLLFQNQTLFTQLLIKKIASGSVKSVLKPVLDLLSANRIDSLPYRLFHLTNPVRFSQIVGDKVLVASLGLLLSNTYTFTYIFAQKIVDIPNSKQQHLLDSDKRTFLLIQEAFNGTGDPQRAILKALEQSKYTLRQLQSA